MHWMEAITWAKCVYSEGDNAAQIMLEDECVSTTTEIEIFLLWESTVFQIQL